MTLTSRVSHLWRRTPSPAARHLWAITTSTTADGVTAHVQIEFTLESHDLDSSPADVDRAAMDAVENLLRQEVGRRTVSSLPVVGDALDWIASDLVPGATIGHVFVMSSDIEVSHELRRLIAASP